MCGIMQCSDIHIKRLHPKEHTRHLTSDKVRWLVVNEGASIVKYDEEPDAIVKVAQFLLILSLFDCQV
jgi:hypothetical protein